MENKGNKHSWIVMERLGKNLANYKKKLGAFFTQEIAINLLLQILEAI